MTLLLGASMLLATATGSTGQVVTERLVSHAHAQIADDDGSENPARAFESPVIPMPETDKRPTAAFNPELSPMSEVGLKALLEVQGYANPRNLSLQDEEKQVYEAEADQFGETIALRVDAISGEVLEPLQLTETQIRNKLQGEGYESVDGLRREGELYLGTGRRGGQEVALEIDARTGDILREGTE